MERMLVTTKNTASSMMMGAEKANSLCLLIQVLIFSILPFIGRVLHIIVFRNIELDDLYSVQVVGRRFCLFDISVGDQGPVFRVAVL